MKKNIKLLAIVIIVSLAFLGFKTFSKPKEVLANDRANGGPAFLQNAEHADFAPALSTQPIGAQGSQRSE